MPTATMRDNARVVWTAIGAAGAIAIVAIAAIITLKLLWKRVRFSVVSVGGRVPRSAPARLRVLSLNVFALPWGFSSDGSGDRKDERLAALCRGHLAKYDVVGLQELFGGPSGRRDAVVAFAKGAGLRYHAGPFPPRLLSRRLIDGGCVLLSRYPIAHVHFHEYRHHMFPDSVACKGVLSAEVVLGPGTVLPVFVTHLQASYSMRDRATADVRRGQLGELADVVRRRAPGDCPALVMGDFNTDAADAPAYKAVRQALPAFEDVVLSRQGRHLPTCCVRFDTATGREVGPCQPVTEEAERHEFLRAEEHASAEEREVPQTIDYIFARPGGGRAGDLRIRTDVAEVEPFSDSGPGFVRISDHSGLRVEFSIDVVRAQEQETREVDTTVPESHESSS